jgi:hypothetical protein
MTARSRIPSPDYTLSPVPSGSSVPMTESACPKGILNISSDVPERGAVRECHSDTDLSFEIWEDLDECPHCGSAYIEFDLEYDIAVCEDCDRHSASILTDDMELETWLMNNLDRFDEQEIIDRDRVGGDDDPGEFE